RLGARRRPARPADAPAAVAVSRAPRLRGDVHPLGQRRAGRRAPGCAGGLRRAPELRARMRGAVAAARERAPEPPAPELGPGRLARVRGPTTRAPRPHHTPP